MNAACRTPEASRVAALHPCARSRSGAPHPRAGIGHIFWPRCLACPFRRNRQSGFDRKGWSLLEVVVASLVAGLMLAGAMLTLSAALRSALWTSRTAQAAALAKDLMEDILQTSYRDPDGNPIWGIEEPSATSRSVLDDVDDYAGWTESPPQARDGTPLEGLSGWQRQVSVANIDPTNLAATLPTNDDRGVRQIRVLVKYQDQTLAELTALRTSSTLAATTPWSDDSTTAAKPAGNQAPQAVARGTPLSGAGQVAVQFDATSSRDPDGDALACTWDFGDGQMGSGLTPTHTYRNTGSQTKVFTAVLTVSDPSDAQASDRLSIVVFPAQP